MTKKLLSILALLLAVAMQGAWAQESDTRGDMKEGPWELVKWNKECHKTEWVEAEQTYSPYNRRSYDGLDGTKWDNVDVYPWDDNDGIGFTLNGAMPPRMSRMLIFAIFRHTEHVPSYTRKVLNWQYKLGGKRSGYPHRVNLHYFRALKPAEEEGVNGTVDDAYYKNDPRGDGNSWRIATFCRGLDTSYAVDDIKQYSEINTSTFEFGFKSFDEDIDQDFYLLMTYIVQVKRESPDKELDKQWGCFKTWATSWDTYYYKFVTFDANGGSGSMPVQEVENSATLTANAFTSPSPGYSIAGWATSPDGTVEYADGGTITATEADKGPVTLYAQWSTTPIDYPISYNLGGGSVATENPTGYTVESEAITLVNPTRDGHIFAGWTGTGLDAPTMTVTIPAGSWGNREYTATWVKNELTLADASDNSTAISGASGNGKLYAVTLPGRTLYKDGYWNTLCLPFALDAAGIETSPLAGATIMALNGTTSNLDAEGLLTLNFDTAYDPNTAPRGSIEAGVPYIVKWVQQADLLINSTEDWNNFCEQVNSGTESYAGKMVRLTNNISVTKMVGTYDNPFCGTFDGNGYTIEVTLNNNGDSGTTDETYGVAPFRYTSGATIMKLHVSGSITTSTRKYAAGIVGMTKSGTNNIQNCWVSAEIYSSIGGDGTHGGIVGKAAGTVNISNCLFDGVLTTDEGNITNCCGGFVGWRDGTLNIRNSLYAPAKIPEGKYAIGEYETYTFTRNNSNSYNNDNCLYTQTLGGAQGTDASAMSNDDKLAALGDGWIISDNRVVPKMPNPEFCNVAIDATNRDVTIPGVLTFTGTYAPVRIGSEGDNTKLYLGAANKLYYPNAAMTIGSQRAYFQLADGLTAGEPVNQSTGVRAFVLNFGDDESTGIVSAEANSSLFTLHSSLSEWYTLDGRRLDGQPTAKGLYIHGGKKVVIK